MDQCFGQALASGDMHIPLTSWRNGYNLEVMLRIPVDGLPVVRKTNLTWRTVCEELLGFTPPPLIPYPNENNSVLVGVRIQINWLTEQFIISLATNASEVLVQRYAHYHIIVWLGSILFMDKSTQRISIMLLQLFNPISNAKKYS